MELSLKRLGILAVYMGNDRLEELPFYKKLSKEGRKLGLEVEVFTPFDVEDVKSLRILKYDAAAEKWVRKRSTFPPLIYDRCRYQGTATYRILKDFRNKYAMLHYLSKPLANKWTMHKILSEDENIKKYIPLTLRYNDVASLIDFLKLHALIYLKPKNGTGGRGIIRIEQIDTNEYLIQGRNPNRTILAPQKVKEAKLADTLARMALNSDYLMQQGIPLKLPNGRVHDYRLLIQKNGKGEWAVTGCAGRIGPHKSITSNLHGGGSAIPMERLLLQRFASKEKVKQIKQEVYSFAYMLAPFLETKFGQLCELGVDIAVDPNGGIWLLEVNPKPSREVFRRIGDKKTYRKAVTRPLEYALWLMKEQSKQKNGA
jgi:glutathione synthase/RimK-type ligase-like ATP-grasp enzyme